jgi:hypothetical protein
MPENRPSPRLNLRSAAFGLLASLMVLLPLGEVLRYQSTEIQLLKAERALLDPLADAVNLQRQLLGHDEVAARVLAGRRQLEAERRLRQAGVDAALQELQGTLSAGFWHRALAEADELGQDWKSLASRIQAKRVDADSSRLGHRLLVEQALQVMDLVSAGLDADGAQAGLFHAATGLIVLERGHPAPAAHPSFALEKAHASLQARSQQLDAQLDRLQAARSHLTAACIGVMLLLVSLMFAVLRRTPAGEASPDGATEGGAASGHRRGPGRRSTDVLVRADDAGQLIRQLRLVKPQPTKPETAEKGTQPPRP